MLQPYFHYHTVIRDHDNYDLAHGPSWARVGPRPGADPPRDTPGGPRHTRSWDETARNLLHAVELLDGMTLAEALDRFNPDGDPAVARLLTRLLTPGLHLCGRH